MDFALSACDLVHAFLRGFYENISISVCAHVWIYSSI